MKHSCHITRFFLLAVLGLCPQVFAQDTFTGSGNWSNGANWSLGRPPQRTDNCVIPSSAMVTSDLAGECLNITIGTGAIVTDTPGYLFIYGPSIVNQGTINIGDGNGLANWQSGSTTTISGRGTINMTTPNCGLAGASGVPTNVIVNADNSIHGQGNLGLGEIGIVNNSLIDANVASGMLVLQSSGQGVTNTGTIQAQNGATLRLIAGFITIPFTNSGVIQASDGSTVNLSGYTYTGGTFRTMGTGVFIANSAILINMTNAANYHITGTGGDTTQLQGTITNNGTFFAQGALIIHGNVTLTGTGAVFAQGINGGARVIASDVGGGVLTNQELIHGGGPIGDSGLNLINQGTVNADDPANQLTIAGAATTNTGLMEATAGATLNIQTPVDNSGGTVKAQTGTVVMVDAGFGGSVAGGTLIADGTLTGSAIAPQLAIPSGQTLVGQGKVVADVTSSGTVIAGDSQIAPQMLTVTGNYTQTATGVLDIGIGTASQGQLAVSNNVTLGGTLNISLVGNAVPAIGKTFTIVTGSAISGQFATVKGVEINPNEHFQLVYGPTAVVLQVVAGSAKKRLVQLTSE